MKQAQILNAAGSPLFPKGVRLVDTSGLGQILLDHPNPFSRYRCKIDARPRPSWSPDVWYACLRIVARWFRDIGGMRCVRQAHVSHIAARLREGYPEEELHWAVDAYGGSKWHRRNKRWKGIKDFFLGDDIDKWIERSPQYQARLDAEAMSRAVKRHAEFERLQEAANEAERKARTTEAQRWQEVETAEAEQHRAETRGSLNRALADGCEVYEQLPPDLRRQAFERASNLHQRTTGRAGGDRSDPKFAGLLYTYAALLADRRSRREPAK